MKYAYFHEEHRINADECAKEARDRQNETMTNYNVYNYFKGNTENCDQYSKKEIVDLSLDTQMHIKDGYGVTNMCLIDNDSKLRNDGGWNNPKEKVQLFTRVFQGVPNINKGGLNSVVEDKVTQGELNTIKKACDRISEKQFDVFTPLVPCLANNVQNTKHVIPEWQYGGVGGAPTRSYIHQQKFLEASGYIFADGVWKKKYCAMPASKQLDPTTSAYIGVDVSTKTVKPYR